MVDPTTKQKPSPDLSTLETLRVELIETQQRTNQRMKMIIFPALIGLLVVGAIIATQIS